MKLENVGKASRLLGDYEDAKLQVNGIETYIDPQANLKVVITASQWTISIQTEMAAAIVLSEARKRVAYLADQLRALGVEVPE
jgi:hypothetical protein